MKSSEAQVHSVVAVILKKEKRKLLLNKLVHQKYLYLMILPGCIYFLLFKYATMWGIVIEFQDYQPFLGILGSEW
ncbi:sugar ABC transporter permease, partial [Bacillus vallismortis]|nr:sugar ABC transporter permease [Bacillus vallismortis]